MEPAETAALVKDCRAAHDALGKIFYGATEDEKPSLKFRRSLYVVKDVKKGEVFTSENVRSIRPGLGLAPKYYEKILGKRAKRNLPFGSPLCNKDF